MVPGSRHLLRYLTPTGCTLKSLPYHARAPQAVDRSFNTQTLSTVQIHTVTHFQDFGHWRGSNVLSVPQHAWLEFPHVSLSCRRLTFRNKSSKFLVRPYGSHPFPDPKVYQISSPPNAMLHGSGMHLGPLR